MIESEFSDSSVFTILEKHETSRIGFIGDKLHLCLINYNTNEYKTKCNMTGTKFINPVIINNNTFSYACLECFNINEIEKEQIIKNLILRGHIV